MGLRRVGRELALKALYRMDIVGDRGLKDPAELFAFLPADPRSKGFAFELVKGVVLETDYIDSLLGGVIANWSLTRLSRIDHNILRIAAFELLRMEDIPGRATIDEAIELAKRYGDRDSGPFVNGVLDMLAGRLGLREKGDQSLGMAKP